MGRLVVLRGNQLAMKMDLWFAIAIVALFALVVAVSFLKNLLFVRIKTAIKDKTSIDDLIHNINNGTSGGSMVDSLYMESIKFLGVEETHEE